MKKAHPKSTNSTGENHRSSRKKPHWLNDVIHVKQDAFSLHRASEASRTGCGLRLIWSRTLHPRPLFTPNRCVGHAIPDYSGVNQWCWTCVSIYGNHFLLIISKESQSAIQFFHYRWWCKVDGLLGATPHMAIRIAKGQLRSLARSISRHFTRIICSLELLIRAIKCLNFSVNNPSKANRLQYLVRKMLVYLWLFS